MLSREAFDDRRASWHSSPQMPIRRQMGYSNS
jgi:hypothetical protein